MLRVFATFDTAMSCVVCPASNCKLINFNQKSNEKLVYQASQIELYEQLRLKFMNKHTDSQTERQTDKIARNISKQTKQNNKK